MTSAHTEPDDLKPLTTQSQPFNDNVKIIITPIPSFEIPINCLYVLFLMILILHIFNEYYMYIIFVHIVSR